MASFFTEVTSLLAACETLTVVMTMENGLITVITTPVAKNLTEAGIAAQMKFQGTPSELDNGFIEAMMAQTESVSSIRDQIQANQAALLEKQKNLKTVTRSTPSTGKPKAIMNDADTDNDDDDTSNEDSEDIQFSSSAPVVASQEATSSAEPIMNLF